MSIWKHDEIIEQIACWKAAYKAASTGRSYTIGTRTLTRYDLKEIRDQLSYLEGELASVQAKRPRTFCARAVVRR